MKSAKGSGDFVGTGVKVCFTSGEHEVKKEMRGAGVDRRFKVCRKEPQGRSLCARGANKGAPEG